MRVTLICVIRIVLPALSLAETGTSCPLLAPLCTCANDISNCNNFTSLDQLNFYYSYFKTVILHPASKIILNENFSLNVEFKDEAELILKNFKGFDFRARPIEKNLNVKVEIVESEFEFYFRNDESCNQDLVNDVFRNIFSSIKTLVLKNSTFSSKVCPFVFKNSNIDTMLISRLHHRNLLQFEDELAEGLNSHVNKLFIVDSDFYLKSNLVNKHVFADLKEINVQFSSLIGIENDLFSSLKNVKNIRLSLSNLDDFFHNGTEWMSHINDHLDGVDLKNKTNVDENIQSQVTIVLQDARNRFNYSDQHFCLFKDFPHNKLVFPIILSGGELECSCTILWLIKYRAHYNRSEDPSDTISSDSANKCFISNFDQAVENCYFEDKIRNCNKAPTSSTTNLGIDTVTNTQTATTTTKMSSDVTQDTETTKETSTTTTPRIETTSTTTTTTTTRTTTTALPVLTTTTVSVDERDEKIQTLTIVVGVLGALIGVLSVSLAFFVFKYRRYLMRTRNRAKSVLSISNSEMFFDDNLK